MSDRLPNDISKIKISIILSRKLLPVHLLEFQDDKLQEISEMDKIVDSHFHIWDFSLRATYPKTDASFDWPDSSLPVIHRNIQVTSMIRRRKYLLASPLGS